MMTRPPYREARHAGRMAVVAHRLQGGPQPANPFRASTKRARYWRIGAAEAERLVGELLELDRHG